MTTITKKAINVTVLVSLLLALTACTGTQGGAPNMVDYSYIPPSDVLAPTPMPTLEDY